MKKILLILFLGCLAFGVKAQESTNVQPKIMVVPFTKEGEDISTLLALIIKVPPITYFPQSSAS